MPSVVLIPTGQLEFLGLAQSVGRLFPGTEFAVSPPDRALDGFTSVDVKRYPRPPEAGSKVDELAARLIAAVAPGRQGHAADFAVVIEDLELVNDDQPGEVVGYFRDAVTARLSTLFSSNSARQRAAERIRGRCSFHLFRPMTEAYFFGDPAALAKVAIQSPAVLPPGLDVERFQTADAGYLNLAPGSKPVPDPPARQRHPKGYLHYLCDPTLADRKRRYRETVDGRAALEQLDWQRVLADPAHCPFLRAFLDDLSDAVNRPLEWLNRDVDVPTRFPGPQNRVLRNI
jgi:hypothetical protein